MKEEIKEILNYLKDENEYYNETEQVTIDYGEIILEKEDVDKLLDYITNLQEENKRLRKQNTEYQDEIFARDNNWYDMQD